MTRPHRLLVAALAALVLLPASAAAELHVTGTAAHGFRLAVDIGARYEFGQPVEYVRGEIRLSRTVDGQTLTRTLRPPGGADLATARHLSAAHLTMNLGARGHVDMRFTPTGPVHDMGPNGCNSANLRGRAGVLKGTFRVRAGGIFHVVRRVRLHGTLAIDPDGSDCSDPTPLGGEVELDTAAPGLRAAMYLSNVVDITVRARKGPHWRLQDSLHVDRPGVVHIDQADDYRTMTATATAHAELAGPFLTGDVDFTPVGSVPFDDEFGDYTVPGTLTGAGLVARFDRLGARRRTLSTPRAASVTRQCEQCI